MSSGSRQAQNGGSNPMNSPVPRITSFQPADAGARTTDPWQLFEERVRWGPYGLTGFPGQSLSPLLLLDGEISGVNHLPRQFVREFPPRRRGQWNIYPEEEPSLTKEQQRKALKELKKHVYNPARNIPRRWSFYNRENPSNSTHLKEEGRDDDGKGCPICLEDFVPNEEVLMTPCNHMFHDVCIRPWVKSHGKCPVCRFTLCDMGRRASSPNDPIRLRNDIMPGELISLVRAVEETFEWLTVPR